MSKQKNRKVASATMAIATAAAIVLTGTFAWQSISQQALNEVAEEYVNPGGRLHDDFNGVNKDVYVENFMSADEAGGVPIFARIRLDEYLETGMGAGIKDGMEGENQATPLIAGADINDVATWTTHLPEEGDPAGTTSAFREYYTWEMGGKTVYMPTFLKNRDSLKADINGTLAGPDGDPATDGDRFGDYTEYQVGDTKTADAEYDADDNDIDEGDAGVENVNYTLKNETHTAAETGEAQVVTMAQWKEMGAPVGPYWVYDTDGWAYWAQAIQPGEATGLLLSGITLDKKMESDWYYGINVVGQFTDGRDGDWGKAAGNGFYTPDGGGEPSTDALQLLHQAAGQLLKVTVSSENDAITVKTASALQFSAAVTIADTTITNQDVTWALESNTSAGTSINESGLITVAADEAVGTVLTVKATSKENGTAIGEMQVTVVAAADGVTISSTDGATSVKRGRTLQFSAQVSKDGSADGVNQTVTWSLTGNTASDTLISDTGLLTVGLNEAVGNVLTVKATSMVNSAAVGDATVTILVLGDGVTVSAAGNAGAVKTARTLQFSATVLDEGSSDGVPQGVTWEVTGNTSASTAIDTNGLLTVGADETVGGTLTVKATSVINSAAVGTKTVTVEPLADTVTVSSAGNATGIRRGATLQFTAQVTGEGSTTGVSQGVTWSVSGNTSAGTAINSNGLLTVGSDETVGSALTVKAISTANSAVSGTNTVTVDLSEIANITPGSTDTVTIDGIEWYVLAKENNQALILSRNILEIKQFSSNGNWKWDVCPMRTYLNGDWLTDKSVLSQYAVATDIKTRGGYRETSSFITTNDKVFLLSVADVFGVRYVSPSYISSITQIEPTAEDYTYNGAMLPAPGGSWIAYDESGDAQNWYLRTPYGEDASDVIHMDGVGSGGTHTPLGLLFLWSDPVYHGVRPALWVTYQ